MKILSFLDFLNENKIYTNINNILKKLNADETTENKVVIMGLFRDNVNFKGVDPLKITLEELNTRYEKQYKESLERLKISFKGNDDVVEPYLKAYCENIKKLKNEAKPFSYKDPEKTLIDVVNNNQQIKGNSNEKLITIDNIDEKDIVFENNEIVIIYIPTQQHAIKYGKGQSQCIANPSLHYFPVYRIEEKATIYYVLFKNKNNEDDKKLCAILNYNNNNQGIADKTNSGDFTGVSQYNFNEVVKILNELKDKDVYLKYVELSDKEKLIHKLTKKHIKDNNLSNNIEEICDKNGINKKEFFTSYICQNNIQIEQFKSFTEDMQESYIELSGELAPYDLIPKKYINRYLKKTYFRLIDQYIYDYNGDFTIPYEIAKKILNVYFTEADYDNILTKFNISYIIYPSKLNNEFLDILDIVLKNDKNSTFNNYLIHKNINMIKSISDGRPDLIRKIYDQLFHVDLYEWLQFGLDLNKYNKSLNIRYSQNTGYFLFSLYQLVYVGFCSISNMTSKMYTLLSYGLDINLIIDIPERDLKQVTILDLAILDVYDKFRGNFELINKLIEYGAKMNHVEFLDNIKEEDKIKIKGL